MRCKNAAREWVNWGPHAFSVADIAELDAFLKSADAVVPLREIARGLDVPNVIGLRHDLDNSLEQGLLMAEWEAERGYRSTYFVLHTAWYYDDKETLYAGMRRLLELGHEVGFHNDTLSPTYIPSDAIDGSALPAGWCERAAALMRELVAELRGAGFAIEGTAAHGSSICRKTGISNMDIWSVWNPADFGFEYEAYQVSRKLGRYISDNNGQWHTPRELSDEGPTVVLQHPEHWPFEEL